MPRVMLRLGQVAEELNVSISTARRLVKRGDLPGCRIGYQIRVAREDLDAYVVSQRRQVMQDAECPVAPAHCDHPSCCFCQPQPTEAIPRPRQAA